MTWYLPAPVMCHCYCCSLFVCLCTNAKFQLSARNLVEENLVCFESNVWNSAEQS